MCVDDSYHLFKAFRMFHLLLMYYDPQLALHLHEQDFPPELYSPQWFLTLYSRSLPILSVLRLWDMFIAIDDPAFTFFIGLCLLNRSRNELLLVTREMIPEVIMKLQHLFTIDYHNDDIINQILQQAKEFYKSTPRLFLRYLRLCCVSTTELMPQPLGQPLQQDITYKLNILEFDKNLAIQSVRVCFMLSTQELIDYLVPQQLYNNKLSSKKKKVNLNLIENNDNSCNSDDQQYHGDDDDNKDENMNKDVSQFNNNNNYNNNNSNYDNTVVVDNVNNDNDDDNDNDNKEVVVIDQINVHQWVIIDIRSSEESIHNGSGILPRAIQIEPDFLEKPDAFENWLQHFDGLKGCNICIIDLPPTNWTGVTLWRRLLLGEGDNSYSSSSYVDGRSMISSSSSSSSTTISAKSYSSSLLSTNNKNKNNRNRNDTNSRYHDDECTIAQYDMTRPAVQFALALQSHSFSNVCVLDGGFPALAEHLMQTKGIV